ncbi:MAG: hypothetical protein RQ723_04835 [Desulfuromonadales bacterium]|nr:hypothetical protein [Desulfuromonadales bacterium]
MSSILKALKKLEEQNRAARKSSPDLPATPSPVHRPVVWRGVGIGVVAGLLAGGLLVWLLVGRSAAPPTAEIAAVPVPDVPAPVATAPTAAKEPSSTPVATDEMTGKAQPPVAVVSDRPAVGAVMTADPVAPAALSPPPLPASAEVAPTPSPAPVVKATSAKSSVATPQAVAAETVPAETEPAETEPATVDLTEMAAARELPEVRMESFEIPPAGFERSAPRPAGPPSFLVSEIVFEPGGEMNMAVINDLPVMEGTVVDGALLRRILVDRVILVIDGQDVEVPVTPVD